MIYRFDGGAQTEHLPADVSVTTSRNESQVISDHKGTKTSEYKQENTEKVGSMFDVNEIPLKDGLTERTRAQIYDDAYSAFFSSVNKRPAFEFGSELTDEQKAKRNYDLFVDAMKDEMGSLVKHYEKWLPIFYDYTDKRYKKYLSKG